jgi:hypothetical protein
VCQVEGCFESVNVHFKEKSCPRCKTFANVTSEVPSEETSEGMEWESEPAQALMLDISWQTNEKQRVKLGANSTVSEKITLLGKQYSYIGSLMHEMTDPPHFYAVVSYGNRMWGPPLKSNGCVDYMNPIYVPQGDLPYVTPGGMGYSVLHCYILDFESSDEEEDGEE